MTVVGTIDLKSLTLEELQELLSQASDEAEEIRIINEINSRTPPENMPANLNEILKKYKAAKDKEKAEIAKRKVLLNKVRDNVRRTLLDQGVSPEKIAEIENKLSVEPVITQEVIQSRIKEALPEFTEIIDVDLTSDIDTSQTKNKFDGNDDNKAASKDSGLFDETVVPPGPRTTRSNIIPRRQNSDETIKKEPAPPKYVPTEGVKQELPHTRETKLADKEIETRLGQRGIKGPVNVGYAAQEGVTAAFNRFINMVRGGPVEETGGTIQPKNFAEQVAAGFGILKPKQELPSEQPLSPREEVRQAIETKKQIIAAEKTAVQQQRSTTILDLREVKAPPPAQGFTRVPAARPPTQTYSPPQRPPEQRPPYRRSGPVGGVPGAMGRIRTLAGAALGKIKDRIKSSIFGKVAKKIVASTVVKTALAAIGTAVAPGVGTAIAWIISTVAEKLWPKIKKFLKWAVAMTLAPIGIFIGGVAGMTAIAGAAASAVVSGALSAMGLGTGLAGGVMTGQAVGGIAVATGTLFGTMAITSAFTQFQSIGPNADFKSNTPPAPVTITKTASRNGNSITYSINKNLPIANAVEEDVIQIVDSNGKKTATAIDPTSGTYTFDTSGLTDVTVINTYQLKSGVINGQALKNAITATAVMVIGNGPLAPIACPVVSTDRVISLGSQTDTGGHCGPGYPAMEVCPNGTNAWRGNQDAIDVFAQKNMVGEPVIVPALMINNKLTSLNWSLVNIGSDTKYGQQYVQYKSSYVDTDGMTKEILIEMHHLLISPTIPQSAVSGDVIGSQAIFPGDEASPHTHVQIYVGGKIVTGTNDHGVSVTGGGWVPAETYLPNCKNFAY